MLKLFYNKYHNYTDGKINYRKNTITITSSGAGVVSTAIDMFIARGVSTSAHQVFIVGIQDRNDGSKTVSLILDLHYNVSVNLMSLTGIGLSISGVNPIGTIGVDGGSGTYDFTFTLLTYS